MLLRFFKEKEYAQEFIKGNIFCNSMEFFRSNITDYKTVQLTASGCLDILEGSVQLMKNYFPYQENKMYKDFSEHLCYDPHVSLPEYSKSHICCFFQYTRSSNISSMAGFGEWCVLIYDFDCFMRKVRTSITKTHGLYFLSGAVEYYKQTINNSVVKNDSNMLLMSLDGYQIHFNEYNKSFIWRDAFCKIDRFKNQQEWRLFLYKDNWNTKPFILHLGNLDDCCKIISKDVIEKNGGYSVKAMVNGRYQRFYLVSRGTTVRPIRGEPVRIHIEKTFTLSAGRQHYLLPLFIGEKEDALGFSAKLESSAFPLKSDLECNLNMTFTYGAGQQYSLVFEPKDRSIPPIRIKWDETIERVVSDAPSPEYPL